MFAPDGIERSRASANCLGSYLHSDWWTQQTMTTTFGPLQGLGNVFGQLGGLMGNAQPGQLIPVSYPNSPWWDRFLP